MKSSEKPSTSKKVATKAAKKVVEPKVKETKTSTTTKKVVKKVNDTEVKKTTKKDVVEEEKKVTAKAKVAKADKVNANKRSVSKEILEKIAEEPTKVDTPKKTTTRKPRAKKEEVKVESPKETEEFILEAPTDSILVVSSSGSTTVNNEMNKEPVVIGPITTEPVVAVPEHVTVTNTDNTTIVHAVTPEKTERDLSELLSHSAETIDIALKDVANTSAIIYDGYNVSNNGRFIASFRKCIVHTDSRDFYNDITFALHNRFQDYPQELFNQIVDILDISPSRFNVIIG